MREVITDNRLNGIIKNYYEMLKTTGYVKHDTVDRLLVAFFLLDFIDTLSYYMDEKDYDILAEVYRKIMADGCCLLPYPYFCTRHAIYGIPVPVGYTKYRQIETEFVNYEKYITE